MNRFFLGIIIHLTISTIKMALWIYVTYEFITIRMQLAVCITLPREGGEPETPKLAE